ncbi:MAG: methionine--tRNA ligase [Fibrobacterota bacterium]
MSRLDRSDESPLVVTMALPYANGDIHLGHMVEAVQTDIFVRAQRMTGRQTIYVCADDTHGTPIELNARKQGITPEELVSRAQENHERDYAAFDISFDTYHSTNSDENRRWAEWIFRRIDEEGGIIQKEVEQYYCEHDSRFLPDRLIKGTCPKCGAQEQYGDVCEKCGMSYDPEDLAEPRCTLCGNAPVLKTSEHFFVDLAGGEQFLRDYLRSGVLQKEMRNFVENWIDDGLKQWCISRDEPYFGFKIPGTENKYFYVWLDAPVGYIASTQKWCDDNGVDIDTLWRKDSSSEVVHFIGKDITYFHTLFWPYMLNMAELKLPSRIFIHGFLTVEGEKMSKSRGTFILADKYVNTVKHTDAAEFLRLYYASKLSGGSGDLDFNIDEFISRINTTLVNNVGNFGNRTFTFLKKYFENTVPDADWDKDMDRDAADTLEKVYEALTEVRYRTAVDLIYAFGNRCNKYFQDAAPWKLIKEDDRTEVNRVMVTCVNLVKTLGTMLKPIVPGITARLERAFDTEFSWKSGLFDGALRGRTFAQPEKLVSPLEKEMFDNLYEADTPAAEAPVEEQIEFDDFMKVKMRVGRVLSAEKIKKAKKLLKLQVDDGYGTRQIIAGIATHYTPEELTGAKVVFVSNLKPAKLMGHLSEGMLLAAENGDGELSYLSPSKDFEAGTPIS